MYESPIDMLIADIQHQIAEQQDEQIYNAVVSVGINVDKEELIRALQYDRQQYELGYADGKVDAMAELVRCKDCKYFFSYDEGCYGCGTFGLPKPKPDCFCSRGERREA